MKKIVMFATALILLCSVQGQVIDTTHITEADQLLLRSKNQKTAGLVTGAIGTGLVIVGPVLFLSEFGDGLPGGSGYNESTANTGEALTYIGIGFIAASTYFFLASRANSRKARALTFHLNMDRAPQVTGRAKRPYPALGVRMAL